MMTTTDHKPDFPLKNACVLAMSAATLLFAAPRAADAQSLISTYYDTSDKKFSVEVISPKDRIRELAICKAVWLADQKNAKRVSLSNPMYSPPPERMEFWPTEIPADWIKLNTTAYLDDEPNPEGNPSVSVADYAAECRRGWDWYR